MAENPGALRSRKVLNSKGPPAAATKYGQPIILGPCGSGVWGQPYDGLLHRYEQSLNSAADRSAVRDVPAFLATTTTRSALNLAQSARSRRETYVGSWLPEPIDTREYPYLGAERGAALEFAVLLLLEKLTPTERAAYLLREAFDYPYEQILEVLHTAEANVRQLVSRARKHISNGRRASVSAAERRRLLAAFIEAAQKGDLERLEKLLASDATLFRRWRRHRSRDANSGYWMRARCEVHRRDSFAASAHRTS